MTYVSWAAFHEGPSDALYFDVLLPRLMEAIILADGIGHADIPAVPAVALGKKGRAVDRVASEICCAKDAFQIVFIHSDAGGRGLEEGLRARSSSYCERALELCGWPPVRCITVIPRHETEAWILADPAAVMAALGFRGKAESIGLPVDAREAERLPDPKAVLKAAMRQVSGHRRRTMKVDQLLPAIAQRQSVQALRRSASFSRFEVDLRAGLAAIGCIASE